MHVVFEEPADERPVVVARFTTPVEAAIARGALAREGIECEVRDAALVGIAWHLSNAIGGVKLVVRREDAELAREVLSSLDEGVEPPRARPFSAALWLGLFALLFLVALLRL